MNLDNVKHIHCIGIGGIGLSAIAEILLNKGFCVSGSDMKQSPVTDHLTEKGAKIFFGHNASNLGDSDLLIYSAAVSAENPEIIEARAKGIPCISRAQALGSLMEHYPKSIAVSGTHGKTTTTSMLSLMLRNANLDPTVLVGGILSEFQGNCRIGNGEYFITEACEYMDSFLELSPKIEIILNIDSDHLDYFKDINHIAKSFETFAGKVPSDGYVIGYEANPFVKAIIGRLGCNVVTFGLSDTSDYYARNIRFNELGNASYDLYIKGRGFVDTIDLFVPGEHNVSNSLAAIAASMIMGADLASIKKTLAEFKGTQRRFDIVGKTASGALVIDDYAHHPTEINATLSAAQKLSHGKIWCLFQPHTYTRTIALFDQFVDAFADADKIVLAEIYAAREKNIYKISSKELMTEIKKKHPDKDVYYMPEFASMADFVKNNAGAGDLVITMGAGDIYKVGELITEQ